MASPDVFVVGGGPAGLASAIALSQKGFRVAVAECALPPIDKACGEGLLPDSLAALRKLGIEVTRAHGAIFRGIRFQEGECSFQADFPQGAGLGVRRPVLHALLIERAQQLGIHLRWGVKGLAWHGGRLHENGTPVRAGLVVAADGNNSQIRRAAGLHPAKQYSIRYGYRRHYAVAPWSSYAEVYWHNRFQIYVTPVAETQVCVAMATRQPRLRLDEALPLAPELADRLGSGELRSSKEMGALSVQRRLKRIFRPGLALAGDAAGSVDVITGEGLGLSFKSALSLAEAHARGDLALYQREHRELLRNPRFMSTLLLGLADFPALRKRVFAGFARRPDVFVDVLAIHVGRSTFFDFTPSQVLGFGREFLGA